MKLKPSKIVAVGLNYRDHAEEFKTASPAYPLIFLKALSSLIFHGDSILYPPQTKDLQFEGELAIIIRDKIKGISEAEAEKHILGYTCANDVTARDLQKIDGQWARAKSFDTFCSLGPKIMAGIDPDHLGIKVFLNGELKQNSNTANMIFSPRFLVAYISQMMTLEPEDVILTGTPAGVGPMQEGDRVVVEIEKIGRLENDVKDQRLR